jgi:large subunit ribosomal protein L15
MRLDNLQKPAGSTKNRKRVGRGPGSGHGRYSGRGGKGARARAGFKYKAWHEGGQMPLVRRVPKRGFRPVDRTEYQVVNVEDLARRFTQGGEITPGELKKQKLIRSINKPVKILGTGELKVSLSLKVHAASKIAMEKITTAGGKVEILS